MHSDFIVFADESGDHSLAKINPDYPVFVLSFCIFRKTDYVESVCPLLQRFKLRWWAHDGVVLHSMRIKRQEFPFVFLKTLGKRERFMADLTDTLARCPFTIIAAVIDKVRLRNQYLQPENPYSLALKFCLGRVHHFFRDRGQVFRETAFLFECRGKREDAELARIFVGLRACESQRKDAGILDRILRKEGQSARAADRRSGQHAHWSKRPSSARTQSRFPDNPAQVRSGA
jgi:hypothetical protein